MILNEMIGKVICGDCWEVMRGIPDNSIDLVVTSPPYNLGNFSKGSFYQGKGKGENLTYTDHNDDMPENEYIEWQHKLFMEWYRLIKNTGAIFYNHKPRITKGIYDDRKKLIPFPLRQEIVWDRCGMVNFSGSFYAPSTERIYIIAKSEWKPNKEFLGMGEVWRVPPETNNEHPAPFPLKLISIIVDSASQKNDVILDPFLGSGTTAVACERLGRKWIGIEISEKYCEIARSRIKKEQDQLKMF